MGIPGNGPSTKPIAGPDGRTFLFQSFASNLRRPDRNQARDLFVFSLSTEDTDADGMDDSWEVAYFGNLNHDGTGDTDNDGQTDLSEFKAGTNPINDKSVLSVGSLRPSGTWRSLLVFWQAVPGKTYRVHYKNSLNDPAWTALPGDITSHGGSASQSDNQLSSNRVYRVLVLP
jgi:hypothetical protein